ncbi:MAG TPA: protein kinase, partial [Gemmatimonas sp.]|nr:protein kinase [Gemmatimonas sp.]
RALSEAVGGETLTQTGVALGTPAYMAPEQAAGESQVDHRADIYALGVVAYEILAGQPPFRGSTYQALVAAQLTVTPAPITEARPSVPAALSAVVHRCLEKRPSDRYQAASDLVYALDRVASSLESGTRESPIGSSGGRAGDERNASGVAPLTPAGRTRRAALGTVAALGLLGTGFGAGVLVSRRSPTRAPLSFQRLTFRRGLIRTARFAPDGRTVLYGALWEGDVCRVYTVRPDSPESAPLNLPPAAPLAVSSTGELALSIGTHFRGIMTYGTLARVPMAGGAPRELQERVKYADWQPDGRELAVVRAMDEGDQLEFPLGTVIARPSTPGGGFSFPRVSPGGDAVAAFELPDAERLNGRVVIVDRTGNKQTTSELYFNVFGLAWRNDEVWFTSADTLPLFRNTVYAMDRSGTVRVVARVPGNTTLHDIAPDGRALIARTDDRTGIAVRAPGDAAERDLSWLDGSMLADISRDGQRILFSEYGVGGGPRESTYLRGTDGSIAVRLGEGSARALSPDGRWAIVHPEPGATHFAIIPTGPGETRRLERDGLTLLGARWLSDGRRVVVRANTAGARARLYLLDVEGNATTPVTPDGLVVGSSGWAVSPDDAFVAVSTGERLELFPLDGGSSRRVPGDWDRWRVVGWIERGLLLSQDPVAGGIVLRVDAATGASAVWADLQPRDESGIMNLDLNTLVVTPDGRSYGYSWHRATSDLYLVDGWS